MLHVNSIPLINVFYYDNCFGSGMQPKLVIDKNLHTLQTHDFFHVEMNVMNCSQNEFKSELIATLNQLKVFQCFDMKKMFDLSRSQVAITSLEDLL